VAETIETTIERVFDPEAGSNRPYNILADDKRFSTFKDDLAKIAKENQGKRGKLSFTVSTSTKGGETYTNYRFENFEPIETLDEELTDRVNGAAPNYKYPTHPRDQASMRRDRAIQMAQAHLQYLPEEERTMSSVDVLFKQYLAILESDA
jgi:hypothetical protein